MDIELAGNEINANIPKGATHVSEPHGITCYYKVAIGVFAYGEMMYYGIESGKPFYGWWWTGSEWQPDNFVRSTHFKKL